VIRYRMELFRGRSDHASDVASVSLARILRAVQTPRHRGEVLVVGVMMNDKARDPRPETPCRACPVLCPAQKTTRRI
jgi:hypothetical protein